MECDTNFGHKIKRRIHWKWFRGQKSSRSHFEIFKKVRFFKKTRRAPRKFFNVSQAFCMAKNDIKSIHLDRSTRLFRQIGSKSLGNARNLAPRSSPENPHLKKKKKKKKKKKTIFGFGVCYQFLKKKNAHV